MRFIHMAVLAAAVFCCTASAQSDFSLSAELSIKKTQADSLQQKADSLENEASRLQDSLDDLKEAREDREELKEDLEDEIDDLREEIADLKEKISDANEDLRDTEDDIRENRQELKEDLAEKKEELMEDLEKRRQTGSFILDFEYSHLDTDPLKDLVKNSEGIRFDFSGNHMLMLGLMGYYNTGNNLRVGNGVYAGYKPFNSDTISRTFYNSATGLSERVDSVVTLRVIPAYVGFICEKAFVYEFVNFFAGFMLGGNITTAIIEKEEVSDDIFSNGGNEPNNTVAVLLAPGLAWDVHGGIAVGLSKQIHLGIDGIVRFDYAYEGFRGVNLNRKTKEFFTVNPGVRLRLTFGRAG